MVRLLLFCLLTMLSTTMLTASTLSRTEARRQAAMFLSLRNQAAARAAQPSEAPLLTEATTPSPSYYAFNIGSGDGFVIISADDLSETVIGYSDTGSFNAATLPANARAWLEGLNGLNGQYGQYGQNGPRNAQSAHPAHNAQSAQSAHNAHPPIRPLLPTQWGQRWPYNSLCPQDYPTGCVATAMAQVMNYHRWPLTATAVIPAYSTYGELTPVTFSWDRMLNGYSETADEESCEAVAWLMKYCGQAVQMRYGSNSWAYEQNIPLALTRFFGYDGGAHVVYRMDFTCEEWETLILNELQDGRPVIYSGQRSAGSHEFVVDGYDGEGFYHFNWGWDGQSNGWYRLPAANPAQVGTGGGGGIGLDGYSTYQSAVVGIQPDRGGTAPTAARLLTAEDMTLTSAATIERDGTGEPFTVKVRCPFANHTTDTLVSGFGLALANADGQLIEGSENLQYAATFVPGSFIYREASQTITFGTNLTGTYRIVPVCNVQEGKKKVLTPADGADSRYIEAVITETTLTLTEHPRRNLSIDDIRFTLMGTTIVATATVSNHGDDYNGLLYLFIKGLRVGYTGVSIPAGETATATFYYNRLWTEQEYVISYTKDESQQIAKGKAGLNAEPQDGFTVWYADGRKERISIEDGVATIPEEAVAVDFGGTSPSTVKPSANPNCLYYVAESSTATERLGNVVVGHYAPTMTLNDGYDFYCPKDFTAGKAVYSRTFTRGYDGDGNGWDTIILPFDVESVTTAGGRSVDWFRSAKDNGKDFWLMTIAECTETTLNFTHADHFVANRPYLIAVPGPAYGERSLQGQTMTFDASDVAVRQTAVTADSGGGYLFNGQYGQLGQNGHSTLAVGTSVDNLKPSTYQLNAKGSAFKGTLRSTKPFRVSIDGR